MTDPAEEGLRERKRRRASGLIRSRAIELFLAQGYRATTMEQIASAAEVAPRTVYRYFPTKDTLVIGDDDDERMLQSFRADLAQHPPLDALRNSFRSMLLSDETELDGQRSALIAAEPELEAAMLRFVVVMAHRYAEAIVEHQGAPTRLPEALALTGAVVGIALVAIDWASDEPASAKLARLDAALRLLDDRLPLGP